MLHNIKNSSERTKKVFAFTLSGVVTLAIFGLWLLFGTPGLFESYEQKQKFTQEKTDESSFMETITIYAGKLEESFMENIKNLGNALNSKFFKGELEYKSE